MSLRLITLSNALTTESLIFPPLPQVKWNTLD